MKKMVKMVIVAIVGALTMIFGIFLKVMEKQTVSVTGSADGPTSIFLAGRLGEGPGTWVIIAVGIVLVIGAVRTIAKSKES